MKSIGKALIGALLATCLVAPAFAEDSTALLVASRGDVYAEVDDDRRALARGDAIAEEERIITGDKSFAVLQFVDGAKVTIRPNSVLDIKEYVYNGGDENAATLSLVQGGLRIITGAMARDFEVEHAGIILFGESEGDEDHRVESVERARIEIGPLLKGRKAVCGPLRKEELAFLFPDAGEVGSAAVMPLGENADLGVIAVGSSDANRYNSAMGTLFLSHIADVIVRLLPRLARDGS